MRKHDSAIVGFATKPTWNPALGERPEANPRWVRLGSCKEALPRRFPQSLPIALSLRPVAGARLYPFPVSTMKSFFKILRIALGPVMLLWEAITRPQGIKRAPAAQGQVDRQCRDLVLYQYKTCPFCIKVRREVHRLSLRIETRDAQQEGKNRDALVRGGGQAKVPCLKITDQAGNSEWLYESGKIIAYLHGRFAAV